jgi:hypothetical protein
MMVSTSFKCSAIRVSPALMHLGDDAGTAQRAAGVSGPVPHALVRFLRPEGRLAVGEGDAHTLADRVQVFPGERENVGQEGFDALVHRVSPPYRLSA